MAIPDETVQFVHAELSKSYGEHKIIIAPCKAEVYFSKTKDFFKKTSDIKWTLVGSGLMAVIYNTKENRERLQLCLASPKTANIIWQEMVVPYTTIDCPHPTFHTLTSTRNYQQRAGVLYQNKCVARLVFHVMTMFTSQTRSETSSKKVMRSQSFCVAPRHRTNPPQAMRNTFEKCTVALSKIHIQQAFSSKDTSLPEVSGPMMATVCKSKQLEISSSESCLIPKSEESMQKEIQPELLTTDLCTTEL